MFSESILSTRISNRLKLSWEELGGRYHELTKKGLECSLVISITRHSNWLITIKTCLCVLSAKMFENPDVSGLLSLHQWKMPLH